MTNVEMAAKLKHDAEKFSKYDHELNASLRAGSEALLEVDKLREQLAEEHQVHQRIRAAKNQFVKERNAAQLEVDRLRESLKAMAKSRSAYIGSSIGTRGLLTYVYDMVIEALVKYPENEAITRIRKAMENQYPHAFGKNHDAYAENTWEPSTPDPRDARIAELEAALEAAGECCMKAQHQAVIHDCELEVTKLVRKAKEICTAALKEASDAHP